MEGQHISEISWAVDRYVKGSVIPMQRSLTDQELRPIVSLRRPVQVMNCICVALQSLLLASCAFPTLLVNIYIVSFTMNATDATDGFSRLEIRVGYFYQCFRTDGGAHWVCGDYDRLERHLGGVTEPWNLRKTAYDLRARAVSPVFL